MIQTILFWLFSVLGIAGGLGLVLAKNPVHSALSLIVNFFSIAGLYLTLNAEFLAVIQILVYAGAIMVLFLFVITLLNLSSEPGTTTFDMKKGLAFLVSMGFALEMCYILFGPFGDKSVSGDFTYGKVEPVGKMLMTEFVFPFEMISVILIAALMGAIIVAKSYNYET